LKRGLMLYTPDELCIEQAADSTGWLGYL
jgi:hypothetical protein